LDQLSYYLSLTVSYFICEGKYQLLPQELLLRLQLFLIKSTLSPLQRKAYLQAHSLINLMVVQKQGRYGTGKHQAAKSVTCSLRSTYFSPVSLY